MMLSIILMLLSTWRPASLETSRGLISDGFAPIISAVSLPFQNLSIFFHDVTGFAQLQADKERLSQENQRLREWYQSALLLESENKSLRALLNMKIDPTYEHISARVISDSGNAYVKSILVLLGRKDNVKKGAAALSGEGLIGRVIETSAQTSRILLVTDINSRVPVVIENTGQHAIMAGANSNKPKLIHLPQESEITKGARLVTSGYGGVYPRGLPVGKVIYNQDKNLEVMLFADFTSLQIVRIVQEKQGIDE